MSQSVAKPSRWPIALILLVLPSVFIELLLQGADLGFWGTQRWRGLAYQFGAFWPGLLSTWRPNYAAQPWTMFLTYAFLHGGLLHLLVNMVTLVSLGTAVISQVGQRKFVAIYVGACLLGGLAFAFLSGSGFRPMVGASGALFGLAGALVVWNTVFTIREQPSAFVIVATILWPLAILVVLNVVMYFGTDGQVAWETHLGGFVAGVVIALPMTPKTQRELL